MELISKKIMMTIVCQKALVDVMLDENLPPSSKDLIIKGFKNSPISEIFNDFNVPDDILFDLLGGLIAHHCKFLIDNELAFNADNILEETFYKERSKE
jgi:hypothetical protein|tara:strand:- start:396 stop:689 length:294 start_codon:yes stop_codon:yes gene_type:complete